MNTLLEIDLEFFSPLKSSLLCSDQRSLIIADLTEIKGKMLEYLKQSELIFNNNFQSEIEGIKIAALSRKESKEADRFINLIILCCINSSNPDLLNKIQELPGDLLDLSLNITDQYVVNDDQGRESVRVSTIRRASVFAQGRPSESPDVGKKPSGLARSGISSTSVIPEDNSEYINSLLDKIRNLEEKVNKEMEIEENNSKLMSENEALKEKVKDLEKKNKDNEFKITVLNTIEELKKDDLIDRIFVYETDEVIKAVAIYEIDEEWFHFKELYVDPCFQNNVVGSRLGFYVLNYAKEQGFKKAYAWVLELNAYARNCYEKFGAKFKGEKKEFDSTGRYLLKYEIDL